MPSVRVKPFAGLLYATRKVPIAKVATEPYDKISAPMQRAYYKRHPYNFVRLILGKEQDRYGMAAKRLEEWIRKGILLPDHEQAFYLYGQTFCLPSLGTRTRHGIVGLLRLEDFSKGHVLPHEHTLAKPRRDRLHLLKATRANLEQIFLLYEDPQRKLQGMLDKVSQTKPALDFLDEKGVRQRLWRIHGDREILAISGLLSHGKLFIADGHHRYTVSLMHHRQVAASKANARLKAASAWRMATFVDMRSPGLVILPTHRVVKMPARWDEKQFLQALGKDFDMQFISVRGNLKAATRRLAIQIGKQARSGAVFGLVTKKILGILKLRQDEAVKKKLAALAAPFRKLDVAILHRLVLEGLLHIKPKSVERGGAIAYIREPEEVARKVSSGEFTMGILQNPPAMDQVKGIALAGECMPQKSTDFYPKLLSGLVVYDMRERRA